jgi:hypothetical protein
MQRKDDTEEDPKPQTVRGRVPSGFISAAIISKKARFSPSAALPTACIHDSPPAEELVGHSLEVGVRRLDPGLLRCRIQHEKPPKGLMLCASAFW